MARIYTNLKLDMRDHNDWGLNIVNINFNPTSGSISKSAIYAKDSTYEVEFTGKFTFNQNGLTGGTIYSFYIDNIHNGDTFSIGELNIDINQIKSDLIDLSDSSILSGNDYIQGSTFNDFIIGYGGNDNLRGLEGNDTLLGYKGNDILDGGLGSDIMKGGPGNDTYLVNNVGDSVFEKTAQGIDKVESQIDYTLGNNLENLTLLSSPKYYPGDTFDINSNGTGNNLKNIIIGSNGDNILNGLGNNDILRGGRGDDTLNGGNGNDILSGQGGKDILDGGAGNDIMKGGPGNDTYFVNSTKDIVTELPGQGRDIVKSSVDFSLRNTDGAGTHGGNVENLKLIGTGNINGIGNNLDNKITGNDANNILKGAAGDDILFGKSGDDILRGGAGDDVLNGGNGNDILIGGSGHNTFILDDLTGIDVIKDLNISSDKINLDHSVFTAWGAAGVLPSDSFISGSGITSAVDSNDHIIYDTDTGALYYDADGVGGADAIQFAELHNLANLTANDIIII